MQVKLPLISNVFYCINKICAHSKAGIEMFTAVLFINERRKQKKKTLDKKEKNKNKQTTTTTNQVQPDGPGL